MSAGRKSGFSVKNLLSQTRRCTWELFLSISLTPVLLAFFHAMISDCGVLQRYYLHRGDFPSHWHLREILHVTYITRTFQQQCATVFRDVKNREIVGAVHLREQTFEINKFRRNCPRCACLRIYYKFCRPLIF